MHYIPRLLYRVRRPLVVLFACLLLLWSALLPTTFAAPTDGDLDESFLRPAYYHASDIIVQPDGKILVSPGGECRYYFPGPDSLPRPNPNDVADDDTVFMTRFNADGSLDPTFTNTELGGCDIALQPDGKILAGTDSQYLNTAVFRFNADGSRDSSFNSLVKGRVLSMVVQPDGKVIIGGRFSSVSGISLNGIARLNADGSRDPSFNPAGGVNRNELVTDLALQPDGKVLMVGNFTSVAGVSRNGIARLNPDGSLDPAFYPIHGANWRVDGLVQQPDGKVVIVGGFSAVSGVSRSGVARLNVDGSLDRSFVPPGGARSSLYEIALQPGGKLLVAGLGRFEGTGDDQIARLNADGSLDSSFNLPSNVRSDHIQAIAVQPDGKVLSSGGVYFQDEGYATILRLHNRLPARLLMSPAMLPVAQDQTFQLDVQVDMASIAADQVQVMLSFDPAMLEVVDAAGNPATGITPNMAVVGAVTVNQVDAATGRITFSATQSMYPHVTGSATVASVYFRPKVAVGQTQVQFVRDAGTNSDLWRGTTPLNTTLESATLRIVEQRTYLPPIFQ